MKRTLAAALSLIAVSTLMAGTIHAGDYSVKTIEAPYATQTPVIDGEVDAIWEQVTSIAAVTNYGSNIYPDTSYDGADTPVATASVKVMWDENWLYVLGMVEDSTPNHFAEGGDENIDGMDIQLSENNSASGMMRDDTEGPGNLCPTNGNININIDGKATGWGGVWFADKGYEKVVSAASDTDQGYIIETAIPLQTITASVGTEIGIEFQINDNQFGASRSAIRQWNADLCLAHSDAAYLGTCVFVEGPVIEEPEVPAEEPSDTVVDEAPVKAPETADAGLVVSAAAMMAAAGIVLGKKRR